MKKRDKLSVYDIKNILYVIKKHILNVTYSYWPLDMSTKVEDVWDFSLEDIKAKKDYILDCFDNIKSLDVKAYNQSFTSIHIPVSSNYDILDLCNYLIKSKGYFPNIEYATHSYIALKPFFDIVNENKGVLYDNEGNEIDAYSLATSKDHFIELSIFNYPLDMPQFGDNFQVSPDKKTCKVFGNTYYITQVGNVIYQGRTSPQYAFLGIGKYSDYHCVCNNCGHHSLLTPQSTNNYGCDEDTGWYCLRCYVECARKCRICGKLYMTSDPMNHRDCCSQCLEEKEKYLIRSYHNNPPIRYYDYDENSGYNIEMSNANSLNFKGYGIELEVGKAGQKDEHSEETIKCLRDEVYAMRDGSINRDECLGGCDYDCGGFEIITFPHTERALYEMNWRSAFKYLLNKGYRSHDIKTCGLHIHISRTLLSDDAIINMMYFYEHWWDDIIKFSRRQGREAERWAGKYLSDWFKGDKREELAEIFADYDRNDDHDMRYKAVNIQNRDTVEIRIMRGTLKLSTFLATLDFMITIAKNANHIDDVTDIRQWLVGMRTETYQYMAERKCFGYDENGIIDENKELEENIKEEDNE